MIWFLIIVGLLIFCPAILAILGISVAAIAIPFLVFFVVWGISIYLSMQISTDFLPFGIIGGFVAGIYVARKLVVKATQNGERVVAQDKH